MWLLKEYGWTCLNALGLFRAILSIRSANPCGHQLPLLPKQVHWNRRCLRLTRLDLETSRSLRSEFHSWLLLAAPSWRNGPLGQRRQRVWPVFECGTSGWFRQTKSQNLRFGVWSSAFQLLTWERPAHTKKGTIKTIHNYNYLPFNFSRLEKKKSLPQPRGPRVFRSRWPWTHRPPPYSEPLLGSGRLGALGSKDWPRRHLVASCYSVVNIYRRLFQKTSSLWVARGVSQKGTPVVLTHISLHVKRLNSLLSNKSSTDPTNKEKQRIGPGYMSIYSKRNKYPNKEPIKEKRQNRKTLKKTKSKHNKSQKHGRKGKRKPFLPPLWKL